MAKKKKSVASKKIEMKNIKKSSQINPRKFSLALKNFILFLVLTLILISFYYASSNGFLVNFFFLISILSGLVSFAFLLVLLIFLVMKIIRK